MDYSRPDFSSFSRELVGAQTVLTNIPIGSKIVHVDILQSGTASNSWLQCGGMQISKNYARDVEVDLAFTSTTTCSVIKTGNDSAFFTVIYSSGYPTSTTNEGKNASILSADGVMMTFAMAILCVFLALLWWKDRFSISRYE